MKPKAKKTLIIVAAVAAIAAVVYFVVRNRKTRPFTAVIDSLSVGDGVKKILKQAVRDLVTHPNFDAQAEADNAKEVGCSYEAWVVQRAAAMPGVSELLTTNDYESIMRETSNL